MSIESFHNELIRIIQQQKEKEDKQDIWKNSPYKDLVKLQSNNVGNVGEEFINHICKRSGIDANCNGSKTKQIGGGEGDGKHVVQSQQAALDFRESGRLHRTPRALLRPVLRGPAADAGGACPGNRSHLAGTGTDHGLRVPAELRTGRQQVRLPHGPH